MALKYHPDKVAQDKREASEKIFQEISHCYEILNDEKSRNQYDAAGYRETNAFGIPFDSEINLQDIFQFFTENFDFDEKNDNSETKFHHKKEKQNKQQSKKQRKTFKKKKDLKAYTIKLKLEEIINDKQHEIKIGQQQYNILIKGGIPNGHIIKDELNGYNWKIMVRNVDSSKIWKRKNDNDCDLYSNVTVTINHILMGIDVTVSMIDGSTKIFNMEQYEYDYSSQIEIAQAGLMPFFSKRKYPKRCSAFVLFEILYPKLNEIQKKKLETFLTSNEKWKYDHNEL